jgi:HEAT repeat protein
LDAILAELKDTTPRADREGRIRSDGRPDTDGIQQKRQDRYYAVHVLGLLKDKRAVPDLIPFLKDTEINYKVAWALGEIGDPEAIEPLIEALGDKNPDVRVIAIGSLAKLEAHSAVPRLRLLLKDTQKSSFGDQVSVDASAREAITKLEEKP